MQDTAARKGTSVTIPGSAAVVLHPEEPVVLHPEEAVVLHAEEAAVVLHLHPEEAQQATTVPFVRCSFATLGKSVHSQVTSTQQREKLKQLSKTRDGQFLELKP